MRYRVDNKHSIKVKEKCTKNGDGGGGDDGGGGGGVVNTNAPVSIDEKPSEGDDVTTCY